MKQVQIKNKVTEKSIPAKSKSKSKQKQKQNNQEIKLSNGNLNAKLKSNQNIQQSAKQSVQGMVLKQQQNNQKQITLTDRMRRKDASKVLQNKSQIQYDIKLQQSTPIDQLHKKLQLSDSQSSILKVYFKHICQKIESYPKNSTFQKVKNIFTTINMTEWMGFCKVFGIVDRCKTIFNNCNRLSNIQQGNGAFQGGNAIRMLSYMYKKYGDQDRRINYPNFQSAITELILKIAENQLNYELSKQQLQSQSIYQQRKKIKIGQILQWLCLTSRKKQNERLRQMGVMCSSNVYVMPNQCTKTQRQSKQNSLVNSRTKNRISVDLHRQTKKRLNPADNPSTISNKHQGYYTKIPKIYKTNMQRKQSKLMHNLGITNLNKINPSDQVKQTLDKFIGKEDRFLRQYFNKHNNVKKGVMVRLERNAGAYGKSRIRI